MRYAVVADIHANLEALTASLQVAQSLDADRLVCLGDIVGYYANPNECVDLIRQHAAACVRGNHDSVAAGMREPDEFSPRARRAITWTTQELTVANRQYLEDLPLLQDVDDAFLIVHASLHPQPNDSRRISTLLDASPTLELLVAGYAGQRICFFGHMHLRAVYRMRSREVERLSREELELDETSAYLINPGSAGLSRNSDPRGSILLYDSVRRAVQFHHVRYDCAAAKEKAIAAGLIPRPHAVLRGLSWLKQHLLPQDAAAPRTSTG